MKNKILIVDDEYDICATLSKILIEKGYDTILASNSTQALNELKKNNVDLVLLDVWLEKSKKDGIELLKIIKDYNPNTPVILISGHGNIEMAVNSMRKGAFYFVEKPFKSEKLFLLIERALENAFLRSEYEILKSEVEENNKIIGISNSIKLLKKNIEKISSTNARIFISGEMGTGKQILAKNIHEKSIRNKKPFMILYCAMLDNINFLKVFFGDYGKQNKTIGIIKKAEGGTIFLKEICDMPYEIQGKFTNFLQKETYSPTGEKVKFSSNIRFISSSDKNPIDEIENKKLRKDLFYRLNVTSVKIPPLRKRREDIPHIIDYYINKIVSKKGLNVAKLTENAYSNLQTFNWPGNSKQVENFVEWLYIMHANLIKKNISISSKNLPKELFDQTSDKNEATQSQKSLMNLPIKEARKTFERNYLINQVDRFGGNISKTANFIGMERSALHRKIKDVGVKK